MMKWLSRLFDKKNKDVFIPGVEDTSEKSDVYHANIHNRIDIKKDGGRKQWAKILYLT